MSCCSFHEQMSADYEGGREAISGVSVVAVRLTGRVDNVLKVRVARIRITQPPISG